MQESALGSVFIFRGRNIGLDNYKSKESLSRVVQTQIHQEWEDGCQRMNIIKWLTLDMYKSHIMQTKVMLQIQQIIMHFINRQNQERYM